MRNGYPPKGCDGKLSVGVCVVEPWKDLRWWFLIPEVFLLHNICVLKSHSRFDFVLKAVQIAGMFCFGGYSKEHEKLSVSQSREGLCEYRKLLISWTGFTHCKNPQLTTAEGVLYLVAEAMTFRTGQVNMI